MIRLSVYESCPILFCRGKGQSGMFVRALFVRICNSHASNLSICNATIGNHVCKHFNAKIGFGNPYTQCCRISNSTERGLKNVNEKRRGERCFGQSFSHPNDYYLHLVFICASMIKYIIHMSSCEHALSNIIKDSVLFNQLLKFQITMVINIESIVK